MRLVLLLWVLSVMRFFFSGSLLEELSWSWTGVSDGYLLWSSDWEAQQTVCLLLTLCVSGDSEVYVDWEAEISSISDLWETKIPHKFKAFVKESTQHRIIVFKTMAVIYLTVTCLLTTKAAVLPPVLMTFSAAGGVVGVTAGEAGGLVAGADRTVSCSLLVILSFLWLTMWCFTIISSNVFRGELWT